MNTVKSLLSFDLLSRLPKQHNSLFISTPLVNVKNVLLACSSLLESPLGCGLLVELSGNMYERGFYGEGFTPLEMKFDYTGHPDLSGKNLIYIYSHPLYRGLDFLVPEREDFLFLEEMKVELDLQSLQAYLFSVNLGCTHWYPSFLGLHLFHKTQDDYVEKEIEIRERISTF